MEQTLHNEAAGRKEAAVKEVEEEVVANVEEAVARKPRQSLFARACKAVKRVARMCFQAATNHLPSFI